MNIYTWRNNINNNIEPEGFYSPSSSLFMTSGVVLSRLPSSAGRVTAVDPFVITRFETNLQRTKKISACRVTDTAIAIKYTIKKN